MYLSALRRHRTGDDEAIKAAEQWKFVPGRKNGEAVAVEVTIMMAFALR